MSDGTVARACAALARGDVLVAYDEAVTALGADGDDLEARFVVALTLARTGATERARAAAAELLARIEMAAVVPGSLREDAEALVARLANDEALAVTGDDRPMLLRRAADLYEATAERFGGSYSRINAARAGDLLENGRVGRG